MRSACSRCASVDEVAARLQQTLDRTVAETARADVNSARYAAAYGRLEAAAEVAAERLAGLHDHDDVRTSA